MIFLEILFVNFFIVILFWVVRSDQLTFLLLIYAIFTELLSILNFMIIYDLFILSTSCSSLTSSLSHHFSTIAILIDHYSFSFFVFKHLCLTKEMKQCHILGKELIKWLCLYLLVGYRGHFLWECLIF